MTRDSACVLVVDDDADFREAVVLTLGDAGYTVEAAANGQEALDRLGVRPEPPCVILLDLMMPVMDGWQFRDRQRADPLLADIPVIAVSAHVEAQSIDASEFLRKPIRIEPLLAAVARFCTAKTS